MSKIRRLYFFDKHNAPEMISFLNNGAGDNYVSHIMFNPFIPLHHMLPLKFKYLPESFVLKDNGEIKGLITVAPLGGKHKKMEIKKLLFEENALNEASELVQFAVSKYKAMGAPSILVKVDDYLPDLLSMFILKCGFSQISYEKLWKVSEMSGVGFERKEFRPFRNSDTQIIANIYNEALLPHFRPLLSKEMSEFKESLFKGLNYYSEYKYTMLDKTTGNVTGCIIIKSSDDVNYIIDIIQSAWVELDINSIISFAVNQIKKRNKNSEIFVRSKRYTNTGEKLEKIFMEQGFECVQNQILLTNSSARVLKAEEKSGKYTILSDFCPANVMPT